MADEPVIESQANEDLETLQPGDEGSLADILAKDREERIAAHTGIQTQEDEALPIEEEAAHQEEEKETQPTPVEELPKFEPKHKTWEETEKSRVEAEKAMHEKAEEAKQAREELAALRKEMAAKPVEPVKPTEPDKSAEQLEAEEEDRIAQVFDEIDKIEDDDPDYKRKVAKIWHKSKLIGSTGPTKAIGDEALTELVDRQVERRLAVKEAETVRQRQEGETARVRSTAAELAVKAGLQGVTDDPLALGTADHIMFWAVAKGVPEELQSQPIEAQVEWATAEVRRRKGEVIQTTDAERERARLAQANNTVMGRGTTQPRKAADPETFTLGGILNEVQEERKQAARSRRP